MHGEVGQGHPVTGHGVAHESILTMRNLCHHFVIGMHQVHHGVQIFANHGKQFRLVHFNRRIQQSTVAYGVVHAERSLRVLAIGILINAFRQPLFGTTNQRRIGHHLMQRG